MSAPETARAAHEIEINDRVARDLIVELAQALGVRLAPPDERPSSCDFHHLPPGSPQARRATLRAWIHARTVRNKMFGADMFADPAWDVILDLYDKQFDGDLITVTSACLASTAPTATAFRYLNLLIERGWVERREDEHDRRRVLVKLSACTADMMDQLMDAVMSGERKMFEAQARAARSRPS